MLFNLCTGCTFGVLFDCVRTAREGTFLASPFPDYISETRRSSITPWKGAKTPFNELIKSVLTPPQPSQLTCQSAVIRLFRTTLLLVCPRQGCFPQAPSPPSGTFSNQFGHFSPQGQGTQVASITDAHTRSCPCLLCFLCAPTLRSQCYFGHDEGIRFPLFKRRVLTSVGLPSFPCLLELGVCKSQYVFLLYFSFPTILLITA